MKDNEHQKRIRKMCVDNKVSESTEACVNQQTFLANEHNKGQLISLLSSYLEDIAKLLARVLEMRMVR